MQQLCRIASVVVSLQWRYPALAPVIERICDYYGFDRSPGTGYNSRISIRIEVSEAARSYSPGYTRIFNYRNGVTGWREGDTVFFRAGDCVANVCLHQECAILRLPPSLLSDTQALRSNVFNASIMSILLLLRSSGHFSLHAAALEVAGKGVLIVAPSDSGKSTLSYCLVRAGWRFLSDDAILLTEDQEGVRAVPFRRHFGLDEEALDIFPELARGLGVRFNNQRKWSVRIKDLFPGQESDACVPRLIVFPRIEEREITTVSPVRLREAFCLLMDQSPYFGLEPVYTKSHLNLLQRLTRQSRAYRLDAGRDILSDPVRAASLLEPLTTGTLSVPQT